LLDQKKKKEMEEASMRLEELQEVLSEGEDARVVVNGTVYPGTRILISDASLVVQKEYTYCKFVKSEGDVKMTGI